jgi:alpha-mannosidase
MPDRVRVTLVPHTHWDREWYEPFAVFSERLVKMMDSLLDLAADGFPHFHLDGQTAMIDDYLERRPDRAEELAARVREGRLSAGPWVTQMDEFLTSGESHIRNLEMGLERARELGIALEVGYMPDQFGHIGQMPQILRGAGIERAMVWRGVPSAIATATFRWQAPDGSEVLTESLPFGYSSGWTLMQAEAPDALAKILQAEVSRLRPFGVGERAVVMVGYDHSGPDASLPDRLAAAAPLADGIDPMIAGIRDHLDGMPVAGSLPVWRGELRSSARAHLLPNVYSSRVHQKRERGRVETLVERVAEPLAALVPGVEWPGDELRRAWTLLLWNGAHDSACGCSHDQVAMDVDDRFAEARRIAEAVIGRALTALGSQTRDGGIIRFNPSPFRREGVPGLGYAVVPRGAEPALDRPVLERLADGSGISAYGVPLRLFDEPDVGDLYNWCFADDQQSPSAPARVVVDGDRFEAAWEGLRVLCRVRKRSEEPFVRLDGVIHNARPDHRLRLHVGLPSPTGRALAGAPFELVDRPLVGEGSQGEKASPTWPARHVAMASGTAVLHEGVFEYEVVDGRALAVTLLRSVGTISRQGLPTRPWPAGPETPTPNAQMIGETAFSLGVFPGARHLGLMRNVERFALSIVEAEASGGGEMSSVGPLLHVHGDVELSNIRRNDGAVEVRIWNPSAHAEAVATVAGRAVAVGPAKVVTVRLDPDRAPTP